MPMLRTWRGPHDIPWTDSADRLAVDLRPAASGCHHKKLSEWMRMPVGARARLECHRSATETRAAAARNGAPTDTLPVKLLDDCCADGSGRLGCARAAPRVLAIAVIALVAFDQPA